MKDVKLKGELTVEQFLDLIDPICPVGTVEADTPNPSACFYSLSADGMKLSKHVITGFLKESPKFLYYKGVLTVTLDDTILEFSRLFLTSEDAVKAGKTLGF